MLDYRETQQKQILRALEETLLAIVAIDTDTDEFEVIYTDGSYREFDSHDKGSKFFEAWQRTGISLIDPHDRERMAHSLTKENLLAHLADGQPYVETCHFTIGGRPTLCRIKVARDVLEPHTLALSIIDLTAAAREAQPELQEESSNREAGAEGEAARDAGEDADTGNARAAGSASGAGNAPNAGNTSGAGGAPNARKTVAAYDSNACERRLDVRTFGRFTVLLNGSPVPLRGRAKEILALLVAYRGHEVSNEEIYRTLWEDRSYSNDNMTVYYNALHRLKVALGRAGIPDLLASTPHGQMVNTRMFRCDYYDWIDGTAEPGNEFRGEFLSEYSWSEYLMGPLLYGRRGTRLARRAGAADGRELGVSRRLLWSAP